MLSVNSIVQWSNVGYDANKCSGKLNALFEISYAMFEFIRKNIARMGVNRLKEAIPLEKRRFHWMSRPIHWMGSFNENLATNSISVLLSMNHVSYRTPAVPGNFSVYICFLCNESYTIFLIFTYAHCFVGIIQIDTSQLSAIYSIISAKWSHTDGVSANPLLNDNKQQWLQTKKSPLCRR